MRSTPICWTAIETPIGRLTLLADADAITELQFATHRGESAMPQDRACQADDAQLLSAARTQLAEYFAGRRETFDLPLRPAGTLFQQRVWAELRRIPFGQTISYGELANRVGNPAASRAVGAANGKNPIGLIVPCHRVIAADGTLGGFSGGLETKQILLSHERGRCRTSQA